MPDIARDTGEKDRRVTAFEAAHHWHSGMEWRCRKYSRRKSELMRVALPRTITSW